MFSRLAQGGQCQHTKLYTTEQRHSSVRAHPLDTNKHTTDATTCSRTDLTRNNSRRLCASSSWTAAGVSDSPPPACARCRISIASLSALVCSSNTATLSCAPTQAETTQQAPHARFLAGRGMQRICSPPCRQHICSPPCRQHSRLDRNTQAGSCRHCITCASCTSLPTRTLTSRNTYHHPAVSARAGTLGVLFAGTLFVLSTCFQRARRRTHTPHHPGRRNE